MVVLAIVLLAGLLQLAWTMMLWAASEMFSAAASMDAIVAQPWAYLAISVLSLLIITVHNRRPGVVHAFVWVPVIILAWSVLIVTLVGWYPYLLIETLRNKSVLGSTFVRSGGDFFNDSGTGDLVLFDQVWESELSSLTRDLAHSIAIDGISRLELAVLAAIPVTLIVVALLILGASPRAREEEEQARKSKALQGDEFARFSAEIQGVTGGTRQAVANAVASHQVVLDKARSDLTAEVRTRRKSTEASRRAREWPQEIEAAVAEAEQQDARIAARRDELRAATDRHLEAMRGASEANQTLALAEAASIKARAEGLFGATLAQVKRQESEAIETVDFPLGASIVDLGARTTTYIASALTNSRGENAGPHRFPGARSDELRDALVATTEGEAAAFTGLIAALGDAGSSEDEAVARRDAAIGDLRRIVPASTARRGPDSVPGPGPGVLESTSVVAASSSIDDIADVKLTRRGQDLFLYAPNVRRLDQAARRLGGQRTPEGWTFAWHREHRVREMVEAVMGEPAEAAVVAEVARQQAQAAAARQEALTQMDHALEQARAARSEALGQAVARMQSAVEQVESHLAAAADGDATAAWHASAVRTAHANLRRSAEEATLKATLEERTATLAAASQARETLLGAIANHREAALQAAASRRLALFAAVGSDHTSWDFASQRLADRRPFSVRVSRVSENELHASIDGVAGVVDASDVVSWDRGPATTPAVVPNEMLDKEISVVATGVLPSGVVRLSEREAVESWTEWSSLWRRFRQREPFFVDIIKSRADGARISYAGWSVDVPYIAPAHEWIHPDDNSASGRSGEPSRRRMVQVTAYDRAENRLAVSEQAALVTQLRSGRAVGESFVATIRGIARDGHRLHVRVSGIDGIVRTEELAWRAWREIDLEALAFEVRQEIPVVLLPQRRSDRRLDLDFSYRRASWPMVRTKLRVGQVMPGVAFEVSSGQVLLQLPGGVLARAAGNAVVAHIQGRGRQYPEYVISRGDIVPVKVLSVNHREVRVDVSYREGRTDASEEGKWKFDNRGRVLQIPEDVRAIFPVESADIKQRLEGRRQEALRAEGLREGEIEW